MEEHRLPNGTIVFFDPEEHKYFVNGVELPSITSIIQEYYGNSYAGVRPEILQASANYGTRVHNEISSLIALREVDPDMPLISEYQEVKNYFKIIEPLFDIKPINTEKVVVIYDRNLTPIAAGRFDLLCTVKDRLTIADFKTTSTIHRQLVSAQLNLYLLGAYQSGYIMEMGDTNLGVIHLSGLTSKYVPIAKFGQKFFDNILDKYTKPIDF